ncbi:MAG: hypothetical protein HC819_19695 [Cyclobacteriaceae bacterium]|nr:hypothetical protein [Cyclobacteriaceae bacterium]
MTAFEILLNNLYDSIVRNEPKNTSLAHHDSSSELYEALRQYIETSFAHGQNLEYSKMLAELIDRIANLIQSSNHEAWAKVKFAFMENDLHMIRRDRKNSDIASLKRRLEYSF